MHKPPSRNPARPGGERVGCSFAVASWNIEFGLRVGEAIATILSTPRLRDVDVLLLQEMDRGGVERIASALEADFVIGGAAPHRMTGRDCTNAVVSRHQISSGDSVELPHRARFRGHRRAAVWADIAFDNGKNPATTVRFVSTHTEIPTLGLSARAEQFAAAAKVASDVPAVVLGGDFNTITRRSIRRLREALTRQGFEPVRLGTRATFGWPRDAVAGVELTLDHLFVRGVKVHDAGVLARAAGSDHLPVWCTAQVAAERPVAD